MPDPTCRSAHARATLLGMLRDVDISLAVWLGGFLPAGGSVAFAMMETPPASPVLALHLHDVREEGEITPGAWTDIRDEHGSVFARVPPQRRYRLTYLLAAWAGDTLAEHEILGSVLAGCAVHHVVPPDALRGVFADGDSPILVRCAPLDRGADPRELWAAWRIPPRASLELSVVAALPMAALAEVAAAPRSVAVNSSRRS